MNEIAIIRAFMLLTTKKDQPLAAMHIAETYKYVQILGQTIAAMHPDSKVLAHKLTDRLLASFTDEELDQDIGASPAMLMALLSLASETMARYVEKQIREENKP